MVEISSKAWYVIQQLARLWWVGIGIDVRGFKVPETPRLEVLNKARHHAAGLSLANKNMNLTPGHVPDPTEN